ncbi:penicillin acylase family protein, partial [Klebsiella pneumoniae]|uniref:penicillin acylase family protein n=1 Tax=Klebsiella pneumoniae TaxID=573 RepID=UPI0038533451
GHNDTVAWGLTIFPADQEDLFVYRLDPAHPGAYFARSGWHPFRTVHETIPVAGGAPQSVTLLYGPEGPVIHQTATHAFVL